MDQPVFALVHKIRVWIRYFSSRVRSSQFPNSDPFAMSNSNRRGVDSSTQMKTAKLMLKSKKLKGPMDSFVTLKPKKWLSLGNMVR